MTVSNAEAAEQVIVCGLGHVGYSIVKLLVRLGWRGVVITRRVNEDWRRAIEPQFNVIVGDAQDDKLLIQAGIATASAVVIVTDDDLANLSIALDARRMNPRAALVIRQFDQDLAVHLEQSAGIDRALSASALAAPPFAAAVLETTVRCCIAAGDAVCQVGEEAVEAEAASEGSTVEKWSAAAEAAVLAVCRGQDVILPREPGTPLAAGDRIVALRVARGDAENRLRRRWSLRRRPGGSAWRRTWMGVRHWWHEIPRALRVASVVLSLIVVVSVLVFRAALNISFVNALYFVVTTITTVGYGDLNLMDAPAGLKLYGVFVMLCGAAILAMIFGITTDFVLRTRLRDVMAHGAAHYRDHIIVAGLGKLGFRLVRDLVQAGETVVAIEARPEAPLVQTVRELVPVVIGNAKAEETLLRAGAVGAKAIVAATDDDLSNLSMALAVKRIQPSCRAVLRVFNSELAEKMRHGMAIDAVLCVSAVAAPTFAAAALCPEALHGFLFGDWLVVLFRRIIGGTVNQRLPKAAKSPRNGRESESILFTKRAGADAFEPATGDGSLRVGDEVLGVRWYPLAEQR